MFQGVSGGFRGIRRILHEISRDSMGALEGFSDVLEMLSWAVRNVQCGLRGVPGSCRSVSGAPGSFRRCQGHSRVFQRVSAGFHVLLTWGFKGLVAF